jgi:hypothetical protein
MAAATTNRRAFVAELVGRRRALAAMIEFALADMAAHPDDGTPLSEEVVAQIVASAPARFGPGASDWPRSRQDVDNRLPNVLFALVASAIESSWSDSAWRTPDDRRVAYLRLLGDLGYKLSSIERRMYKAPAVSRPPKHTSAGGA